KLAAFAALPEANRKPGAVTVEKATTVDPKRAALTLPPRALVVRVFNRHLGWNEDKSLRYVVAKDYLPGAREDQIERYGMAQNDFMWVPEEEWRALVPSSPRPGASHPVPVSFSLRLFRYHLDPARGFTEGANFTGSGPDAGRLTLTVRDVTPGKLV